MAHEYKEYLEEIKKDIDDLAKMKPTPERIRTMHDYLCVEKYLMKRGEYSHEMMDERKSYFGG